MDTGLGMDASEQNIIFDSYAQGRQDQLVTDQGTGLGLAICKKLSQELGGTIWAESEPGKGSTFWVKVPLKTDGEMAASAESCDQSNEAQRDTALRILLVEDQAMNQIFTVDLLTSHGHKVELAENGQQALDILREKSFDLVLMDIKMPVMDGIEATKRIRTSDPSIIPSDIPIIALSAHAVTNDDLANFRHTGFNQYVIKPISFEKLFTAMQEAMHNTWPEPRHPRH